MYRGTRERSGASEDSFQCQLWNPTDFGNEHRLETSPVDQPEVGRACSDLDNSFEYGVLFGLCIW